MNASEDTKESMSQQTEGVISLNPSIQHTILNADRREVDDILFGIKEGELLEDTQTLISTLQDRIVELESENEDLRGHAHKKKVIAANGFCSYIDFYAALVAHLGTGKRALTVFVENSSYTEATVQQWRRRELAPIEALAAIDNVPRETATLYQRLTPQHRDMIDKLSETHTDAEIMETMNELQSERIFNINMVKSAKAQIRSAYVGKLHDSGYTAEEAKAAFIQKYPRIRMVDKIISAFY